MRSLTHKTFVSLALLFCLGGCSLAPRYVQPDTALPDAFPVAENTPTDRQGAQTLQAAQSSANRAWWATFDSKALTLLQGLALSGNHNLAADRQVLAQRVASARASRSALFPSLDMNLGTSRQQTSGSASTKGSVNDAFSGSLQAKYELDLWGKNQDTARSAAYTAQAGLNALRSAGLTLESEVALTWFAMLAAEASLQVYDAMLENAREVLNYQEKRNALGAALPLEVARQRHSVQAMEADRVGYQQRLDEARDSLCLLLGVTALPAEVQPLMREERLMALLPPAIDAGLPAQLLVRRPDIAEAEARLQAANADLGVARAAFLPIINLTVAGSLQSTELARLISPESTLLNLAASLVQSIFNGGKQMAQIDVAQAVKEELAERYRQAVLAAFWEVSTALGANNLLAQQEAFRDEATREATEAYRIARAQYEAGAEDYLALITAQDALLSTQSRLVETRLQRLNSVTALFKALGGGWGDMAAAVI